MCGCAVAPLINFSDVWVGHLSVKQHQRLACEYQKGGKDLPS